MPKQLEIVIYGLIGSFFYEDGVTARDILNQLNEAEEFDEIFVRINSPGGNAYESLAIYTLLAQRKEKVIGQVDGIAASGASLILQACTERKMVDNGMFMYHAASMGTYGNRKEHETTAKVLDKLDRQLALTYGKRSTLTEAKVREELDAETWYTAAEAKSVGLIDEVIGAKDVENRFDLTAFKNVPRVAMERFGKTNGKTFAAALGPASLDDFLKLLPQTEPATMSDAAQINPPPAPTVTAPVAPTTSAAPPAAPVAPQVDAAKIATDAAAVAKAGEKERSSKILAICNQAGKAGDALTYIQSDLTVADVQAKLFEAMCKDRTPVGDAGGSTVVAPAADVDTEAKKEYKANPHLAKVMTEADFIAQKKRDEDHGYVMPKTVAEALAGVN